MTSAPPESAEAAAGRTFTTLGVVGLGTMGAGIAEVFARHGYAVVGVEQNDEGLARGRQHLEHSTARAVKREKLTEQEQTELLDRISFTTELKDLRDRQFVLESIAEDLPRKLELFATLDAVVEDPGAVLASNTSSIPIMRLGRATADPSRVVGAHFFNPVQVMPLVEVIGSLRTSADVLERTTAFLADSLGKQVVRSKDQAGFVVNSLFVPFLLAAVRMVEAGVASAEDVDRGMTAGCGHPMGPLALVDLIGLDTIAAVGTAMYEETKEPLHAPPTLLLRMVEGGLLGRKAGRGFYEYAV